MMRQTRTPVTKPDWMEWKPGTVIRFFPPTVDVIHAMRKHWVPPPVKWTPDPKCVFCQKEARDARK